jgi:hypothetical protein
MTEKSRSAANRARQEFEPKYGQTVVAWHTNLAITQRKRLALRSNLGGHSAASLLYVRTEMKRRNVEDVDNVPHVSRLPKN